MTRMGILETVRKNNVLPDTCLFTIVLYPVSGIASALWNLEFAFYPVLSRFIPHLHTYKREIRSHAL